MTVQTLKRMLDACYLAKRVRDLLPELPEGVSPSFIQYLDTIQALQSQSAGVKVSDVSDALGLPRPGVTRTVKDMVAQGYLEKSPSRDDGRVTHLSLTAAGAALLDKYDRRYFPELARQLGHISQSEAECMIAVVRKLYDVMEKGRDTNEQ